jgi:hypothetical protein
MLENSGCNILDEIFWMCHIVYTRTNIAYRAMLLYIGLYPEYIAIYRI